jgi:hypothetical protein
LHSEKKRKKYFLERSLGTSGSRYSRGRDQEEFSLKPVWAKSSKDPISKKINHKKGLVEWLKI